MPAPFFCVSGCREEFGDFGIPGGVRDFGGRCVGAAMRASVWRGKEGARSEDCPVLGRLLGTRRIAGRSEGGRGACGSLCVFRARLVNAWAGSCRELPEGTDCWLRIAGGRGGGAGRGPLESGGVGCLEAICLAGTSLDAGKGLRMRRVAGCSGVGLKPGGGVPAFVGSRNRESRAYEGRRRGGNIRGAGISYEIPAPGWCLLT